MPLQSTSGAASYDAFGGGAAAKVNYIEDFFQSYLRTGTGASATVTTGLDGSTKETLVWTKSRSAATNHKLTDNVRGVTKALSSNTTDAEATDSQGLTAFSATGYTLGTNTDYNNSGATYVDWQWVAQPKFFDVVTYTGNGTNPRNISHNLGSVPGCVIAKRTDAVSPWCVYHRGISPINDNTLALQSTAAASDGGQDLWGNGATVVVPTSTVFTVSNSLNTNGATYVAYLFAHNAGGFGLTGTDNVISCGSVTGNGTSAGTFVNLGYEPQWILMKDYVNGGSWLVIDNMRGFPTTGQTEPVLLPNDASAETPGFDRAHPQASGFNTGNGDTNPYIYIAIRRGPMKVPTLGTSVFTPIARTGTGAVAQITGVGFPPDLAINADRTRSASANTQVTDRLRGTNVSVFTNRTDGDLTYTNAITAFGSDGETLGTDATQGAVNVSGNTYINWLFRRAPGFFDVVCYTGTGANRTVTHNLTVAPELMIFKQRDIGGWWMVYPVPLGNKYLVLQRTDAVANGFAGLWNSTAPTSSVFSLGTGSDCNQSGGTYVAYLFATLAGISKVFSYTGNGSSQTINCGFTAGSRFVMIKRTDSTGDWYVWDSARGIVAGNDPHLSLNDTAAEVTTDDSVDTDNTGFVVNQLSATNVNVTSATYIGLAIA